MKQVSAPGSSPRGQNRPAISRFVSFSPPSPGLNCLKVHSMFLFMTTRLRSVAIGHLDADCFYVSAERVRDEFLLKKPVGVLGNKGACVSAKSYEMKAV